MVVTTESKRTRESSQGRRRRRLVPGLAVALLMPAVLAWLLWAPRAGGDGGSGVADGAALIGGAGSGGGVISAQAVAQARARLLPRPPGAQPVPLAGDGAPSVWGERFASAVAAVATLTFHSARRPRRASSARGSPLMQEAGDGDVLLREMRIDPDTGEVWFEPKRYRWKPDADDPLRPQLVPALESPSDG